MKPGSVFLAFLLIVLAAGENERTRSDLRGACTRTGPEPKCPCWWDLTQTVCACCKGSDAMQCGWPMHKYCYKKSAMGCPGVCNNKHTLSGKGFPCYNDKSKGNNCAWCAAGAFQCYADGITGPDSKDGSRCQNQKNQRYCTSVQGDCRHIPTACPGSRCREIKQMNKYLAHSQCECPEGYHGNGIQCYSNGALLPDPNIQVELTMDIKTEEYQYPFNGENFSSSLELQTLITEMSTVKSGCESQQCQATFNKTETQV